MESSFTLTQKNKDFIVRFSAMASQCEVLLSTSDKSLAEEVASAAFTEAKRIEHKFSRYRSDNIVNAINHCQGRPVAIDPETVQLFRFADSLHELSNGLFDITSGVLRRLWKFDGSNRVPKQAQIDKILPYIGWEKVKLTEKEVSLPKGMEIDFGGIGKEYAVDRTLALISDITPKPCLINFGGDLACNGDLHPDKSWLVGIESNHMDSPLKSLKIDAGALATSGDKHRFIIKNGHRYTHLLNPTTGWPIENHPQSVTVAGRSCVEAGSLSSLAMLQGEKAEPYLLDLGVNYWIETDQKSL